MEDEELDALLVRARPDASVDAEAVARRLAAETATGRRRGASRRRWRKSLIVPIGIGVVALARAGSITLVDRLRDHLRSTRADQEDDHVDSVHSAVAALDPADQQIIRLIHWDGFSQVEVAQLLDRPAGTIRSRYARARAALKEDLGDRTTTKSLTRGYR